MNKKGYDVKKEKKETSEGTYKGYLDDKVNLEQDTDSDIYAQSACIEEDTKMNIPTDEAVKRARKWTEDNQK